MRLSIFLFFVFFIACSVSADFIIEDFEPPNQSSRVTGYPGEDIETTMWRFDSSHGAGGTSNSLYIYGNSWKRYDVSDMSIQISPESVWEIWIYITSFGTNQSFGISDGTHELRYIIECYDPPPTDEPWLTEYAGCKSQGSSFVRYKLPVGMDWNARYGMGSPVQLSYLLFINDADTMTGRIYFDQIKDISDSEPASPTLDLGLDQVIEVGESIQFSPMISDPDSSSFQYLWDFGDGSTSTASAPSHQYNSPGNFNVNCRIKDPTSRYAMDSVHITVGTPSEKVVSLLFGGDLMLGRRYEDANEDGIPGNSDGSLILPGDGGLGAKTIASHTRRAYSDLRIVNLETPLTDEGSPHPTKSITYRSRPDAIAGVTETGIGLVGLANNHLIDYMEAGLEETLEVLANPSGYSTYARPGAIPFTGAGMDIYEASLPASKAFNGFRVGFLAFCSIVGHAANEQPFFIAGYEKPGVVYLNSANLQAGMEASNRLHDFTVVMIHGGIEYDSVPSSTVMEKSHEAIDLGADLVICHHPHVSQGIEYYNGVPIVFSLGNFFFDQKYQQTMLSFMVEARVDRMGCHQLRLLPINIEYYEPKFTQGDAGIKILNRLQSQSAPFETSIINFDNLSIGYAFDPDITLNFETDSSTQNVPTNKHLSNYYLSSPMEVPANKTLAQIVSLASVTGTKSIMTGEDRFMFGNFEEDDIDDDELEGPGWDLTPGNTSAMISDYSPHEGEYCLRLRRHDSHTSNVEVNSSWRIPVVASKVYAVSGWTRLVNAKNARISVRFYYYPYTYESGWDQEMTVLGPTTGNQEWTFFTSYFIAPSNLGYATIFAELEPPDVSGYGYLYLDEIRLIEFTEISNPMLPIYYNYPTSIRYVALKTLTSQTLPQMTILNREISESDTDGDGLIDIIEDCNKDGVRQDGESDVYLDDTDGDGLDDFEESIFGIDKSITCPWEPDSDGDGFDDYVEYIAQTNPNDNLSHPSGPTATATVASTPTQVPSVPTSTPSVPSATPSPPSTYTPFPTPSSTRTSTATMTPESSPTPTMTPFYTATPSPTGSAVPTETPPSTVPPTSTPSPTNTPTSASSATNIPTSTVTAVESTATVEPSQTPGSELISIDLILSSDRFVPGTQCWINLNLVNGIYENDIDLYVLLEVYGSYFGYPSWRSMAEALDHEDLHLTPGQSMTLHIIDDFLMPPSASAGPFMLYAASFYSDHLDIESLCSNFASAALFIGQ